MLKLLSFPILFLLLNSSISECKELSSQKLFEAQYAQMKIAMEKSDWTALRAMLAANFQSIDTSGNKCSADKFIESLKTLPPDPNRTGDTIVKSAQISGDQATVEQMYVMKTKNTGPDGKVNDINFTATSKDSWIKASGKWLLQSTRTLKNQIL